jgi:hypothetical protein
MKKTLQLILVLFLAISCELKNDDLCFTPPRQFNFDIVNASTLENLFLNETFTEEALKVYDETGEDVEFKLVFHRDRYILSLSEIGWKLEPKTYTIELSPEVLVVFNLSIEQQTSNGCTYFEVKEFKVIDYEYEELLPSGIIQIKIELN